jgi:hypothetical protein
MDYLLNHWQTIAVVVGVLILLVCYRWLLANVIRENTLRGVPKT